MIAVAALKVQIDSFPVPPFLRFALQVRPGVKNDASFDSKLRNGDVAAWCSCSCLSIGIRRGGGVKWVHPEDSTIYRGHRVCEAPVIEVISNCADSTLRVCLSDTHSEPGVIPGLLFNPIEGAGFTPPICAPKGFLT